MNSCCQCYDPLVNGYISLQDEIQYRYLPAAKYSVIQGVALWALTKGVSGTHLFRGATLSLLATTIQFLTKPIFELAANWLKPDHTLRFFLGFFSKTIISIFLTSVAALSCAWITEAELITTVAVNLSYHFLISGYVHFFGVRGLSYEREGPDALVFMPI